jgi:hypothetical protein
MRHGTGTHGDTVQAGRERDRGHARGRRGGAGPVWEAGAGGTRGGWVGAHVSQCGWVCRPARRLVRPLGPGDGPMDPSP